MEIIVVSDSHGKNSALQTVLDQHQSSQAFIHCGDMECDPKTFPQFVCVKGNNDLFYDVPDERFIEINQHRIYITHGHHFAYQKRTELMAKKALENDCDIVLFGHSHVTFDKTIFGVRLINPGSIWRSRDALGPSYAIITLLPNEIKTQFVFLNK